MLKFMRKIPGGLLLIPMLLAAVFNTFAPSLFKIGGITESLFTSNGINAVVGLVCFCSAVSLDLKKLIHILQKQGILLLVKIILCFGLGIAFMSAFGQAGVWGISAIAFVATICSVNPSLYLALVQDYGEEEDVLAFGLVGLLCVPAFPLLVYSVSYGGQIDWMPVISTVFPIALGILIGNLDKDLAKLFSPGVIVLTPFMGWTFGSNVNLIDASKSGLSGILITLIFYVLLLPVMFLVETKVLKQSGISTLGLSSIAGMSVAVPFIIAASYSDAQEFAAAATAQIAFGVVLSSIITPFLAQKLAARKGIKKNLQKL